MSTQPQTSTPSGYLSKFNRVTAAAAPRQPGPASRVSSSERVAEFIGVCDVALDLAFDDPREAVLAPDVDVPQPGSFIKAYLLFLTTEGICPTADVEPGSFDAWYERVSPAVWSLLGFEQPPSKMMVGLTFSLLGQREHQAPELRALIWALGELAAVNLMPGLRS